VGLALLLLVAFVASLALGEVPLRLPDVVQALRGRGDPIAMTVVRDFRLPRTLVGTVVGAALAASGVVMQAFFRNALASPGLLGVSSGAALARSRCSPSGWVTPSGPFRSRAIGGAFLSTAAVVVLARRARARSGSSSPASP